MYNFIKSDDERIDQFATRRKAVEIANMQSAATGRKHQVFLNTTYRDLIPKLCWAVILALHWHKGELKTK